MSRSVNVSDSVRVFGAHAPEYGAQRRRLVPCFDLFYGTAVDLLAQREGPVRRVLDLGAGTGLLGAAVLDRYPDVELMLLDGAEEMLRQARDRLPARLASSARLTSGRSKQPPAGSGIR